MGTVPGFYVDAVRLGDRDVLGQAVDLDGSLPIRVIYKPNGGRVLGTVEECAGATVVVLPLDESLLSNQFIRTAGCDASGKFEIANLRPGDYSAAAFDRILESGAFEDPVFVRNLAPRLTKVQVAQGQSTSIQLRVTSWPE